MKVAPPHEVRVVQQELCREVVAPIENHVPSVIKDIENDFLVQPLVIGIDLAAREFEVVSPLFCLYPMSSRESSLKAIETLQNLKSEIDFEKAIIFP
ncbi:hypothetical protein AKJ57_03815 [candidate division MSBL1 archaeon SCGC-AAA259A05]|uniref:Uncharacterized protein n=1 Tax=candidate division MSBL1 archaeon SCGC-AAA259A05 TaxID=1698259 RepID=A0A133U9A3_9EURY|nr:hypothetical protein AKJ57_03815 [candidate division MSBL1 archaeon SCGC-AAA259A05]